MIIHHVAQRSQEWHNLRERCFLTGSELGMWLVKNDATSRKAKDAAIARKLAAPIVKDAKLAGHEFIEKKQASEDRAMEYNHAVARGTFLEPMARARYEEMEDIAVTEVGFITTDDGMFGVSPDGMTESGHGIEIKCPWPDTHISWLLKGELPGQHKLQVHGSMIAAETDRWDFLSFCPGLPELRLTIRRSDFTNKLATGILQSCAEYLEARSQMARMVEEWMMKQTISQNQ